MTESLIRFVIYYINRQPEQAMQHYRDALIEYGQIES